MNLVVPAAHLVVFSVKTTKMWKISKECQKMMIKMRIKSKIGLRSEQESSTRSGKLGLHDYKIRKKKWFVNHCGEFF